MTFINCSSRIHIANKSSVFFYSFFFLIKIEFPETDLEFINPEPEERRDDLAEPTEECMKHIARLSQAHSLLL